MGALVPGGVVGTVGDVGEGSVVGVPPRRSRTVTVVVPRGTVVVALTTTTDWFSGVGAVDEVGDTCPENDGSESSTTGAR